MHVSSITKSQTAMFSCDIVCTLTSNSWACTGHSWACTDNSWACTDNCWACTSNSWGCTAIPHQNRTRVHGRDLSTANKHRQYLPLMHYYINITSLFKYRTDAEECVRKMYTHLPTKNSSGSYGMSSKLLKIIEPSILKSLTLVNNQGISPDNLIIAKGSSNIQKGWLNLIKHLQAYFPPPNFMGRKSGTRDEKLVRWTDSVGKKEARKSEIEMRKQRQERLERMN